MAQMAQCPTLGTRTCDRIRGQFPRFSDAQLMVWDMVGRTRLRTANFMTSCRPVFIPQMASSPCRARQRGVRPC
jgi:hypothetical protein